MKGKTTYFTEYLRYKHDSFFEGSVAFTFQLKQISLSTTRTKAYLLMVLRCYPLTVYLLFEDFTFKLHNSQFNLSCY
jgi:hypothetical protein